MTAGHDDGAPDRYGIRRGRPPATRRRALVLLAALVAAGISLAAVTAWGGTPGNDGRRGPSSGGGQHHRTPGVTLSTPDGATLDLVSFKEVPASSADRGGLVAGHTLYAIDVRACASRTGLTNKFGPASFSVVTTQDSTLDATLRSVKGQIPSEPEPPGACVRGAVGFEVPDGQTPYQVFFERGQPGEQLAWVVS